MRQIPAGSFRMGSNDFYPEERPVHVAVVEAFWMDEHPVTNAQFAEFVQQTDYVTVAETAPDPADFPGAEPAMLVPGALVFTPPGHPVRLDDFRAWWSWIPGAQWRHPWGPGSTLSGLDDHPVVQVAYADAVAYAEWAGCRLPTEAQWERAARGLLDSATFEWGEEFAPGGQMMANTWQGEFPVHNDLLDGFARTSPVGRFPANGFGLVDMTGNVWEWTCDDHTPDHRAAAAVPRAASAGACCAPRRPEPASRIRPSGSSGSGSKTIKGGSHLCAPNYCLRYRPAARQAQSVDTATSHIGFRCVTSA